MSYILIFDCVALIAAVFSLIVVLLRWKDNLGRDIKAVSSGLFIFTSLYSLSLALEWSGTSQLLEPFEDLIGALIPMWWAFTLYSFIQQSSKLDLLKSETKYNDLTENLNVGIYRNTIGHTGKFIDINSAFVKMFGYDSKNEINQINVSDLYQNPDDRVIYNKKMLKRGSVTNEELNFRKKDGTPFIGSVYSVAVKDESGKVKYYDGIVEDITNQKNVEKLQSVLYEISQAASTTTNLDELYQAIHNQLTKVIDTTNFFIALIDENENTMSFPYFVDEYDDPPDPVELTKKTISEYVIQTGKPLYFKEKDIIELVETGTIDPDYSGTISKVWLGSPLQLKNKSIGVIVVQSYNDPDLFSESDLDILNFVSEQIAVAIERKLAEGALSIEKAYLEELIESSPLAIAVLDDRSNIQRINKEFTNLFGHGKEVKGKNIDVLLTSKELREEAQQITADADELWHISIPTHIQRPIDTNKLRK